MAHVHTDAERTAIAPSAEATHRHARSLVPAAMRAAIDRAIDTVLAYGDSFVLPPGYEIEVIRGRRNDVADLAARLYLEHPDIPDGVPMVGDVVLAPVGHAGFRPITQLDPIWNIYLLALVIAAGPEIERARVPAALGVVHSFRFESRAGVGRLFDTRSGWHSFCDAGRARAAAHAYVLSTDICSFSQSICYRRLERALREACADTRLTDRIMSVVRASSGGASFGLPVGAPAFSLLAELVLDSTDRMLLANGVEFIRYIDDFRIFAASMADAQRTLLLVADRLSGVGGFSLQKTKTKILSSEEFLSRLPAPSEGGDAAGEGGERAFMRLRMHFDRDCDSTAADAEALGRAIRRFDVVGLLAADLRKPQVGESLAKRAVKSIAHVDAGRRSELISLFGAHLERFAPVFPSVAQAYLEHADTLDAKARSVFSDAVKGLYFDRSHVMQVSANQSWAIRVLARHFDERSEEILAGIYRSTGSAGVRRDVVIAMSNGGCAGFIQDARARFSALSAWDRRAVIAASHMLEGADAGWSHPPALTEFERVVWAWALDRRSLPAGAARIPL